MYKSLEKSPYEVQDQENPVAVTGQQSENGFNYISGWRLHVITIGLFLGIFLVNFEVTIVSTAIVSITNDLEDFVESSWIITAYLITYIGGQVIWAKLSDLFGRKTTCITAIFIFTAFSAGCGAAQTMVQLIVCRAFQGVGGSGIYSIQIVMLYELVPTPKYPLYTALAVALVALANAIGPIFGGLIAERSTWRWVFYLNIPTGVVAATLLLLTVPANFPNQGRLEPRKRTSFKNVDFIGALLMLSALALIITGFERAATLLSWTTAETLGPLCASAVAWIAFLASQYWYTSRPKGLVEPVFPWRFCQSRIIKGLILTSFMSGAVTITFIFELPLHYQTASGCNPLQAGLRLLPYSLSGPVGSIFAAGLSKKLRIPPLYLMIFGGIMQIIGLVFVSRGRTSDPDWPGLYGIEVVVGWGVGMTLGALTLLTPFLLEKRDLAVGTAATIQFRFLGGAIVVSIVTAVGNSRLKDTLSEILAPLQILAIFRSTKYINTLPANLQTMVRGDFVEVFNLQMRIVLGFTVAGVFAMLLMWQKPQVRVQ